MPSDDWYYDKDGNLRQSADNPYGYGQFKVPEKERMTNNPCLRCGNTDKNRTKMQGHRTRANGTKIDGLYCKNVLECEKDAWTQPCCQYCHEQFWNPAEKCKDAPIDPWGNQNHVPGGRFWSAEQRQQVEKDTIISLDRIEQEQTFKISQEEFKKVERSIRDIPPKKLLEDMLKAQEKVRQDQQKKQKGDYEFSEEVIDEFLQLMKDPSFQRKKPKKLIEDAYFCETCGRTEKPSRPTKCLECSKKMGWRKGY